MRAGETQAAGAMLALMPEPTRVLNDQGFIELVDHMGSDASVIRAARVSFGGDVEERPDWADERLIRYLLKNHHTSPFEHVVFTFHVKAPLFVARQWMRHRTWSFNEISARYAKVDEGVYFPDNWRAQSTDNKQASDGLIERQVMADDAYDDAVFSAEEAYDTLLRLDVSREMARMALPVGTFTRFYGTVDLHNLLHFLCLRDHEHAQAEIVEYARAIKDIIEPIVPVTMAAWRDIHGN